MVNGHRDVDVVNENAVVFNCYALVINVDYAVINMLIVNENVVVRGAQTVFQLKIENYLK